MNSKAAHSAFNRVLNFFTPQQRATVFYGFVLAILVVGVVRAVTQYRETNYVNQIARNVVAQAGSKDTLSTLIALRDYLLQNVRQENFSAQGRPFLRNTAAETLASGQGFCGESTRAFINMADDLGIHARRLYLEGRKRHVVALVTLEDGQHVIVDSSDQPYFRDIARLDEVSSHPEFDYYSSFNPGRMIVGPGSNAINLGPLRYYLENPNALIALLLFVFAFSCLGVRWLRYPVRNWRKGRPKPAPASKDWQHAAAGSAQFRKEK